jgi:hypothetical protein
MQVYGKGVIQDYGKVAIAIGALKKPLLWLRPSEA